jgi:hypothetical protein
MTYFKLNTNQNVKIKDEAFRDTIGTIDQEGKENLFFLKNLQESSMTVG